MRVRLRRNQLVRSRFVIALHSPDGALEPDCSGAFQRKRQQHLPAEPSEDTFSGPVSGQEVKNCGDFPRLSGERRWISLQTRLRGGGGSLALTFLCPNSLLTGNLTGNFEYSGPPKAHFLSLSLTF